MSLQSITVTTVRLRYFSHIFLTEVKYESEVSIIFFLTKLQLSAANEITLHMREVKQLYQKYRFN